MQLHKIELYLNHTQFQGMVMGELLNLLAVIILFGIAMWLINALIPMPPGIKMVLNIVVLIIVILYALDYFDLVNIELPKLTLFK